MTLCLITVCAETVVPSEKNLCRFVQFTYREIKTLVHNHEISTISVTVRTTKQRTVMFTAFALWRKHYDWTFAASYGLVMILK